MWILALQAKDHLARLAQSVLCFGAEGKTTRQKNNDQGAHCQHL
jgi:hypothetical protein